MRTLTDKQIDKVSNRVYMKATKNKDGTFTIPFSVITEEMNKELESEK